MKNKKGGEQIISVMLLINMAIVAIAIAAAIFIFNPGLVDVRGHEASILTSKVLNCLVDGGEIREEVLNENFDIFQECSIDKEIINNSGLFYLNVSIKKPDNKEIHLAEAGVKDFKTQCELKELGKGAEHFAVCKSISSAVYDKNGENQGEIYIYAGSNQEG